MRVRGDDIGEFLRALSQGDATARRALFRHYWGSPFRQAVRILRSEGDAHDVTADVFVDFMDRLIRQFRGTSAAALQSYLIVSTVDRAIRHRDRRRRLSTFEPGSPDGESPTDSIAMARLESCLQKVPPRARRVVALKYGHDLDNTEVARLLGVSRAAISKILVHRSKGVLVRLRECLKRSVSRRRGTHHE